MAKSSYEIRMNYKRAVEQANTLEQIAADMRNSVENDLQECINEISCNWVGNNANAYMAKCQRLGESVRGTAENLKKTADTIRKIAKNTYTAEMRALELARIRKC